MRGIWAAAFLLKRMRVEVGMLALIVALVGVTSFLGASAPRLYNAVADAGLRDTLGDAAASRRNVELSKDLSLRREDDPSVALETMGSGFFNLFGDPVQALIADRQLVATTPRFSVLQPPQYTTFITLRHQSGLDDAIRLVDGRWPASTGERLDPAPIFEPSEGPSESAGRIEIAVSTTTAEESGLAVGQAFDAAVDGSDPLLSDPLLGPYRIRIEIVGLFEIDDPTAAIWYGDNRLEHVGAFYTINEAIIYATALIAPDALPDLVASGLPLRYSWRYFVDPGRLDAGGLETATESLRRLETTFPRSTIGATGTDLPFLRTELVAIISRYLAQRSSSDAVLSVAAIGPLALAAAAIGMLAVLLNNGRRAAIALTRSRGASPLLLLGAQLWEGLVFGGAGAVAGYALAVLLVPGRPSDLSIAAVLLAALGGAAMLTVAAALALRRPIDESQRSTQVPVEGAGARRLVLEGTAVGLAVVGIALLQQRGLTIGTAGRNPVRFDPFLAGVPMLAGFAAGIVTARVYPLPVRFLGWLAARRRDLVPVLGLRNVSRRPSFATLPMLVLLSTAAFGSFALVVMAGLDRGQVEASWREVGADYRVETEYGTSLGRVDALAVPGVEAVATATINPSVSFSIAAALFARIQLVAIDAPAYAAVAGSPVSPEWPAEMLASPEGTVGTADNPVPAILSATLPQGAEPIRVGDSTRVRVGDATLYFRIVAIRPSVPGVISEGTFLVAPISFVSAGAPGRLVPNVLFVRGSEAAEDGLRTAVAEGAAGGGAVVTSRHRWLEELRAAPLIGVVANGFRLALAAAVCYAAVAIIAALVLTATRRAQDLAFLRPLGLSSGQSAGILIVEHGLPILLALGPGIAMGVALGVLLEPSLGLDAFLGGATAYRIYLDWPGLASVAGLLVGLVLVSIAASTWLARRASVVDALRAGDA